MSVETEDVKLVGEEAALNVARAVVFAAVTAATAPISSIQHPLFGGTVPLTLQTLWVYLGGIVLGPVWGAASFTLYMLSGALGLPVFAEGASGMGVILGPTGGYIVGFVVGAFVIGLVAHGGVNLRDPREIPVWRLAAAIAAGSLVVWGLGGVGLVLVVGYSLGKVLALTSTFLLTGAIKAAAAIGVVRSDAIFAR
ncbi:MAG: biotin transporter BioY [Halobacteriaceae archaeon]